MKVGTWFAALALVILLAGVAVAQPLCPFDKEDEPQELSIDNLMFSTSTVGVCAGSTFVDEKAAWSKSPAVESLGENESVSFGTTSFAYGILAGTGGNALSMETKMTPRSSSVGLETEKLFSYSGIGASVSESVYSYSGYPAYGVGMGDVEDEAYCESAITGFNSVVKSGSVGSMMDVKNVLENGMKIDYTAAFAPAVGTQGVGASGSSTTFGKMSILSSGVTTQYSKSVTMIGTFSMEHTFSYNSINPEI